MRSAEAASNQIWEAANSHWLQMAGNTPGNWIQDIIGERALYRTPAWVEPLEQPGPSMTFIPRMIQQLLSRVTYVIEAKNSLARSRSQTL